MRATGAVAGREAARRGGGRGDLTAPVQRLPDFLSGQVVPWPLFPEGRRCSLLMLCAASPAQVFSKLQLTCCRDMVYSAQRVLPESNAVPELTRACAQVSSSLPSTSYRQGVRSAALHDLYAPALTAALTAALERFSASMPGLLCDDAVLYGAETRTSSPARCLQPCCAA